MRIYKSAAYYPTNQYFVLVCTLIYVLDIYTTSRHEAEN